MTRRVLTWVSGVPTRDSWGRNVLESPRPHATQRNSDWQTSTETGNLGSSVEFTLEVHKGYHGAYRSWRAEEEEEERNLDRGLGFYGSPSNLVNLYVPHRFDSPDLLRSSGLGREKFLCMCLPSKIIPFTWTDFSVSFTHCFDLDWSRLPTVSQRSRVSDQPLVLPISLINTKAKNYKSWI